MYFRGASMNVNEGETRNIVRIYIYMYMCVCVHVFVCECVYDYMKNLLFRKGIDSNPG